MQRFDLYLRFFTLAILLTVLNIFHGHAQSFNLQQLQADYSRYEQNHLQEKIYVHTDRSFYVCGQIMWFKIYLTNAATNDPLSLDKVAYIEVMDNNHEPLLQGKISMKDGLGSGSFYLPFTLPSGNYEVRAYTNWMKNYSPENYFRKIIAIVNTTKNLDSTALHDSNYYNAGFYPEGGNLVNGINSEVAFKVVNQEYKGADCSGVIVDNQQDTLLHFKPMKFGMGHFFITPESGKKYTAIITMPDSSVIKKDLPEAYDDGYVMHVSDSASHYTNVSILINEPHDYMPQYVYIVVQNHEQIDMADMVRVENGHAGLAIDQDSLHAGISQITVFDQQGRPMCERLCFKRPENKMIINAVLDQQAYKTRSKVTLSLSTAGQSGKAVDGNLSVAVYRLDDLHHASSGNIYNYLWLQSDLRGWIESPGYYFSGDNDTIAEAMDNLLLTQGWRKFDWNDIENNSSPVLKYVPEYIGHIITGKITNEQTGDPAPGIMVYLSVPGRRIQFYGCISDSNGLFHFDATQFYGANQIVVKTDELKDSIYRLEIYSPFSEAYANQALPFFYFSKQYEQGLQESNLSMELANAYQGSTLQQFIQPKIDTTPFFEHPYKTYMLDDYTRFTTMEEVMREYVTEVGVRRNKNNFRFITVNQPGFVLQQLQPAVTLFEDNPLVLLDGVPVFNINKIIAYDPLKVWRLQVVAERYYWGPIVADGIVSYTTYKGNLEGFALNPHVLLLDYEGLQEQRQFYSPQYTTVTERASRLPDFRDLLYWSPDISTGKNGQKQLSFYTGDVPGKYLVVVQGITSGGKAGCSDIEFSVEK